MNRALRFGCTTSLFALFACSSTESPSSPAKEVPAASATPEAETEEAKMAREAQEADALATKAALFLSGDFDSSAQAKRDPEYRAIRLAACAVDGGELGKHALYVEQSVVGSATPYRQRIYIVEAIDATATRSLVFELKEPTEAVGLCERATKATFTAADVLAREGCHVELHWVGDHFVGHTPNARWNGSEFEPDPNGAKCPSSLQGASHAQSSVELREGMLRSWDQGFDDKGKQVWGAIKGPYEFVRKSNPDTQGNDQ